MATETAVDVVMPQMGVSVSEGTITRWLKSPGEEIAADESLLEISTDKVDTEVPSPASGVLREILAQEGETVAVGTKIALIAPEGNGGAAAVESVPEPATARAGAEADEASDAPSPTPTAERMDEVTAAPEESRETTDVTPAPAPDVAPDDTQGDGRGFVSPVVARIAAEHGVDVGRIEGTGRGGRVTKKDILGFIESGEEAEAAPPHERLEPERVPSGPPEQAAARPAAPAEPSAPAEQAEPSPAQAPVPPRVPAAPRPPEVAPAPQGAPTAPARGETVEPMTPMRKGIAEHMRRSLDTSAHVTTTFEVDLSKVVALRNHLRREYEERHGVRLTYLSFIARATIDAIGKWPWMNAEIRGDSIVSKGYVNLGIAVALEGGKGLIVPVVKNAEEKSLLGLARAIADLAERARTKKLLPDDVQGGTFTITNPGGFGAIHGTPIISQPQVAILDVEALVKRPVVITDENGNDAIGIRPMMNLCLSYDHRLVDGAYAAQFMRDLRENLQSWDEAEY